MTQATLLWSIWQALLQPFTWAFTRPGHRRFVEWVTALALTVEEHTITQSVVAIDRKIHPVAAGREGLDDLRGGLRVVLDHEDAASRIGHGSTFPGATVATGDPITDRTSEN